MGCRAHALALPYRSVPLQGVWGLGTAALPSGAEIVAPFWQKMLQPFFVLSKGGQMTAQSPKRHVLVWGGGGLLPFQCSPRGGGGGVGTRPQYLIVCLWRRLLASRHCSF